MGAYLLDYFFARISNIQESCYHRAVARIFGVRLATLCQTNIITITEAIKIKTFKMALSDHGIFHVIINFRSVAILMKSSHGDSD